MPAIAVVCPVERVKCLMQDHNYNLAEPQNPNPRQKQNPNRIQTMQNNSMASDPKHNLKPEERLALALILTPLEVNAAERVSAFGMAAQVVRSSGVISLYQGLRHLLPNQH